jgi:nitroimidazol reductase NimA-like FMN-containing flavoprotein (pyridoxamine 5'-phosphate oxidase superfamily)
MTDKRRWWVFCGGYAAALPKSISVIPNKVRKLLKNLGSRQKSEKIITKNINTMSEIDFYRIRREDRILDNTRAIELLQNAEYGFLSLGESRNGYPYGVPMSFAYSAADNALYFHCALEGHKLDNLKQNNKVAFCVVGNTKLLSEKFSTLYESVIVFGHTEIAQTDEDKRFALRKLLEKYSPNHLESGEKYMSTSLNKAMTLKINIEHITAKTRKM